MHRIASTLGRRPAAVLLEVLYVLVAVVVHSVAAIALAAGLLAVSMVRRRLARRPSIVSWTAAPAHRPAVSTTGP